MKYIHFIVNPISGNAKHNITIKALKNYFPETNFKIEVDYTKFEKHAIELTKHALIKKPDYIVACGGDGTINEVACCLVNTNIKLGIIPFGSGNGLASNLNIPSILQKACQIIQNGKTKYIDVGKVNEHYFFSNMGVGIEALIIKKYDSFNSRNLISYLKATLLSSFQFRPINAILSLSNQTVNTNVFVFFISNSNEMGYRMSLTPKARLDDGLLDVIIISKLNFRDKIILALKVITKKVENFRKAQHLLLEKISFEMPDKIFLDIQIDGEYYNFKTNKVEVNIIKSGLEVLVD